MIDSRSNGSRFASNALRATRHSASGIQHEWVRTLIVPLICLLGGTMVTGCASLTDPNVPEPIRAFKDPLLQREYLLYRPSAYTRDRAWPLIVACHGGFPDSPNAEIRDWDRLAERYGFLVLAPKFTAGGKPGEKLREDEAHLRSAIQHVRAGHTISEDRILMYGRGTGTRVAMNAALRQPEMYRALAVTDPDVTAEDLAAMRVTIDPYQPILMRYNPNDILSGKREQECVDALRSRTPSLRVDTFGSGREANVQRIVEFFQDAIRKEPWLHVRALPGPTNDPLEVAFRIRSSFKPSSVHWQFGDGGESTDLEPTHRFEKAGSYHLRLRTADAMGDPLERIVQLNVPELTVQISARLRAEVP